MKELIDELNEIDRRVLILREKFNIYYQYHLAGELSAVSIILKELKRYCFEKNLGVKE